MQETELLVLYKSIILLVFISICPFLFSQDYPEASVNNILKAGISDIINQNYVSAKARFFKLKSKYPDLPLGNIYLAAVEIARSYDYGEEFNEEYILNNLTEGEEQADKLIKTDPENPWNLYFKGIIRGYKSYYYALNGTWFNSIKEAISSASYLEQCIKKDPDFYEAYSGIGSYKYWKSKKIDFLNWLPFIEDEKEEGVTLLENAVRKSSFNTYLAVNSLIWIYIDKKDYSLAIKVSEKALQKYPNCRSFKWGIARAYEELDPKKAIIYYNEILNSFHNLRAMNRYNEIVLKHLIAQQYAKLGEFNKALKLCKEILSVKNLGAYTTDKLGNRLTRVNELKLLMEQNGG